MNFIAGEEQSSAPSSSLRACPWRTWDEWLSVFRSLYSDCSDPDSEPSFEDGGSGNTAALLHLHQHCSDRQSALAHIENCWRKSAHNKLPVAVCATAALMQARRADDYQLVNEYEVRSLYALAIVRFVNQLADQCQTGQYAKSVAKLWTQDLGWPAYIVDLRHAAAHGDLPSVNVLRLACGQLLGLLRERYWEPQMAKLEAAGIYPAGGKEIRGLGSSGKRRGPAVNKTEAAPEVVDPLIAAQEYFESERERNRGVWERENATAAKLAAARKQKQRAQEKIANRKNRLGKSNAAAQKQLRELQESPETPETADLERAIPFKHPGRAKRHAAAGVLGATSPAAAEHLFVAALKEGAMEKNMAAEDEFEAHFRIVFFLDWFELACDAYRADFCNRVLQLLVLWKDFSTSLRDLLKQLIAVFVREGAPQFRSTFRDVARGRLFDFDEETLVFVCGLVPALKEAAHVILFPALEVGVQAGASPAEKKVAVAEEDLPEQANERPRTTDAAVELVPDATTAVPRCKRRADGEIDLDEQSNVGEDGDDADLAAAEQEVANLARNRKKRCRIDYSFVWQPVGSVFRFDRSSTAVASARGGCQASTPPAPQGIGAGDKGSYAERFTDDGRTIRIPASLLADPLRGCDTRERARYSDSTFHAAVKGDEIAITGKSNDIHWHLGSAAANIDDIGGKRDRRVFDTPSEVVPREERVFDTPSEVVADELVAAKEERAIESILAELKPFGKLGK
eukprot:g2459.t1